MFEAVIFDLDGTLIHSNWVWPKITKLYLQQYGIKAPKGLDILEGKGFTEVAQYFKAHFNVPQTIDEIKATWNAMGTPFYTTHMTLKENLVPFLKTIKVQGVKTGIATSNSKELTEKTLNHLGIYAYFEDYIKVKKVFESLM